MVDGAVDMDFEGGEGHLRKGDSLFIPADAGRCRMRGKGKFIITEIRRRIYDCLLFCFNHTFPKQSIIILSDSGD